MTVKDFLSRVNPQKIFDILWKDYFNIDVLTYRYKQDNPDCKEADEEIKKKLYDKNKELVIKGFNDMLSLEPIPHPNTICLVIPCIEVTDEPHKLYLDVCCIDKDEFLNKFTEEKEISSYEEITENPLLLITYNFMYEKREDILGYEMSPVKIEAFNHEIAAAIFWELTWFGFDNETAEKNQEKSKKELDEVSEETGKSLKDILEDISDDADDIDNEVFSSASKGLILTEEEKNIIVKNRNTDIQYFNKLAKCFKEA